MKLIGAGFGRTGTKSLKSALELLGYGPCYHMAEVLNQEKNPDHLRLWDEAGQGKAIDWKALFQAYQSTVDWPSTCFYRELMDVFPEAKVLLSIRDPESWHKSAMSTIFVRHTIPGVDMDMFYRMVDNLILNGTFHGRYSDRDYATSIFLNHIEQVKQTVPGDRLLVYEVREGWQPLCQFLQVPIPDMPFPRENSTEEWEARLNRTTD
jgi:Sulfotransferase domain